MSEHILIERTGAIQIIRLNRADKKNAITRAMYATMAKKRSRMATPMTRCVCMGFLACRVRSRPATTCRISWLRHRAATLATRFWIF